MASSSLPPLLTDPQPSIDRKPNRRTKLGFQTDTYSANCIKRWKDQSRHRIYSTKLYEALQHVRMSCTPSCRRVKDTACRLLAVSARGRSRWSRAIIARKARLNPEIRHRKVVRKALGVHKTERMKNTKKNMIHHPLEKRIRILGGMIPGCRKLSLQNLLEEAADYISALEMQLRVMGELAEALDGTGDPISRDQAGWSET